MPFSIKDFTQEHCEQWKLNKLRNPKNPKNPQTNYRIEEGSKVYKLIESHCDAIGKNTPVVILPIVKSKKTVEWTQANCEQWEINKTTNPEMPVNPISLRKVSSKSASYKKINQQCSKFTKGSKSPNIKSSKDSRTKNLLSRKLSLQDCLQWMKNKTKNPVNGYTLGENSKILKAIQKECKPLIDLYNTNQPRKSSPDISSLSPVQSTKSVQSLKNSQLSPLESEHNYLYYPELDDEDFREKLVQLSEYYIYNVAKYEKVKNKDDFNQIANKLCGDFEKTAYQYFVSSYISNRTPYKSILLYHRVGVGKTCSAITLAEGFLTSHSMNDEVKVWVIMPLALKNSFKEQIFNLSNLEDFERLTNQCTGDLYIKLAQILREGNKEKMQTRIKKIIKSRYKLFTYDSFATFIDTEYISKNRIVKDKVIIVDEAHNIRSMASTSTSSENAEKRVYTSLTNVLSEGVNNRLVLLSATPMYNRPEDIFDLLYLLCLNDKRQDILKQPFPMLFTDKNVLNKRAVDIIEKLSRNYISYLKGKNPFTFAVQLSPKYLEGLNKNIQFLNQEYKQDSNGKIIASSYDNWLSYIPDGIVTSMLGSNQIKYVTSLNSTSDDNNVFNNLQPMNIVYEDSVGERGFNTFFTRTSENNKLTVKYNKNFNNALFPDETHLGKYSGKILNICKILQNTTGIAVIYSGYIWSGIIPMAVCLEHMGFMREGAPNILANADIINNPPKYNKQFAPRYCILSSENTDVMGGTSIDNMIQIINSRKNIDGSQIKVILITPVASEGLSFFNVREMHIMEPWFHFNRVTQIIGRGIRNCRHQELPLENRNVTVFMHGSIYPQNINKETTDIHAFRIASKKMLQSDVIDNIIRDNAVDCMLMKNINYFSKDIFELGKIKIITSQGIEIDYSYGDDEKENPKCTLPISKNNNDQYLRRDTYKHLIFAYQNRLRKIILNCIHNKAYYIQFADILQKLDVNKSIIYDTISASVYPNILIDGYILIPHEDGLHIIDMSSNKTIVEKLRINTNVPKISVNTLSPSIIATSKCNRSKLNKIIEKADNTTIALYLYLTSECFEELVKTFIESRELSDVDTKIADCLYTEGALINNNEIKSTNTVNKYIGYVNIFNTDFEPIIYDNGRYRDLIDREKTELIANRIKVQRPTNMTGEKMSWGMIMPVVNKNTNIVSNTFKLLTAGSSIGVKTGIVCTSLQKQEQDTILKELGVNQTFETKAEYCYQIAFNLMQKKRLTLFPEYKPRL
jgi:hypothetical protein